VPAQSPITASRHLFPGRALTRPGPARPGRPGPLTFGGHGHHPAALASLLPETAPSWLWFDARGSEGFYSAGRHIRHAQTGQSNPGTDHAARAVHQQQRAVVVKGSQGYPQQVPNWPSADDQKLL
jgi:hypothetical protein